MPALVPAAAPFRTKASALRYLMFGFIKLHRKICKWEWYQDANTFRLFIHLLLEANHENKCWQGKIIQRGQAVIGLKKIKQELGLSVQKTRTSLNKLKSTHEITIETTNKYSIITLINYDSYQSRESIATSKTTHKSTNEQQTDNKQVTTNKNVKKVKNVKEKTNGRFAPPTHTELQNYLNEKNLTFPPDDFIDHFVSNGWKVGGKAAMKDWKAAARQWDKRQYDFHPEKKPVKPDLSRFAPDGTRVADSEGKLL